MSTLSVISDDEDLSLSSDWVFLNDRSKGWNFDFYPDNFEHFCIYWRLLKFCHTHNCRYAYVLHDKDLKSDGSPAKPHIHFYVYLQFSESNSGIYKRSFFKQLNLSEDFRFCIPVKGEKAFVRYLLHYDQPDKFQYDITCLHYFDYSDKVINGFFSTPRAKYKKQFTSELKGEDGLTACLDLIDTMAFCGMSMTYRNLTRMMLQNGYYKPFKQHQTIIYKYFESWILSK